SETLENSGVSTISTVDFVSDIAVFMSDVAVFMSDVAVFMSDVAVFMSDVAVFMSDVVSVSSLHQKSLILLAP
nr:hypothetical protein [Tolypothrix carrinoi HA7290-LM1]